ncbi:MAG: gamma carbonic anhydrase family protein [Chromatiales bacterium]|jgi:carbonic anhydrase/acetyltransferase-like protein (isoleucine patch superfamily)|nr:gamma carbonic anhydrase family protein [Chromatiales bacterium]MDX9767526.1 gamma carbonic anhydrase family protein [Ectothiorhodospiraceae bacterium]
MIRNFDCIVPKIHGSAWIDETALVIGDVVIGADSSLWPGVVARGDIHRIVIGERSNIQDGSILHVTHDGDFTPGGHPLIIGNDVTVGHRAILHGCAIGDLCLIGMGAIVMDNAVIGAGALIGAGSLVPPGARLEGGFVYVGSPVRQTRPLTENERARLHYSARYYVELKERHRNSSCPVGMAREA